MSKQPKIIPPFKAIKPVNATISTVRYSPAKSWHGHSGSFAEDDTGLFGPKPARIPKNKTGGEGAIDGE